MGDAKRSGTRCGCIHGRVITKTGNDRFYEVMVPLADKIYDKYLNEIEEENNG